MLRNLYSFTILTEKLKLFLSIMLSIIINFQLSAINFQLKILLYFYIIVKQNYKLSKPSFIMDWAASITPIFAVG